jgi:hypothetical protein
MEGCKAAPLAGGDIEHAYNLLVIILRYKGVAAEK